MKTLGKILLLFIVMLSTLFAKFEVSVSDDNIALGDQIIVTFASDVSDNFPVISDIAGFNIESRSQERSSSYINGAMSGSFKVHYVITPTHTFTIPSYTMDEKGSPAHSKPITVKVSKVVNRSSAELSLEMKSSKQHVVVGEPFFVTLTYKQNKNLDIVDRQLIPPKGEHFWVEKKPKESQHTTPTQDVITLRYVFTPQKAGNLTIMPAQIKVGERSYRRDAWGMLRAIPTYKTLFSDAIKIKVDALPQGVDNVGDFSFSVSVDKNQSNERDAVNLTVKVEGEGNIVDIPKFHVAIDGVLVYDEDPVREHHVVNGHYEGVFKQKFALVGSKDYTIPALSFSYYDLKKKKVITKSSQPIDIKIKPVQGSVIGSDERVKVEKIEKPKQSLSSKATEGLSGWVSLLILCIGIAIGVVGTLFFPKLKYSSRRKKDIKINRSDMKSILAALMPYSSDPQAKEMIEMLSENLYEQGQNRIDKKVLKALMNRLGI